jgi:hypothetical protein
MLCVLSEDKKLKWRTVNSKKGADSSGHAVCGRLLAGIGGSNPAGDIDVCVLLQQRTKGKARAVRTKKYT